MPAAVAAASAEESPQRQRGFGGQGMREERVEGDEKPSVHHLALRTADVERLAAFYIDVLGLVPVRFDLPRSTWLALADGAVLMIEARSPGEPAVPAGSLELFALRVSPERKIEVRAAARARACYDGETEFTVYLRDPDGRRLGVSTYTFDV